MIRVLWLLLAALLLDTDPPDDEPDEDDEPNDKDTISDPMKKITALKEQVARLAMKLDKKDAIIKKLEAVTDDTEAVQTLRIENAYLRTVISRGESLDTDTAWDLLHSRGFADAVEVSDDGEVEGMDDAIDRLVARYPWLADLDGLPDDDDEPPLKPSGRKMNKKKSKGPDTGTLMTRFPALKGRVKAP